MATVEQPQNLPFLYMEGQSSTTGYLVTTGHAYVQTTTLPLQKISADKIVIGTLEYFLRDSDGLIPSRKFSLAVSSLNSIRPVSFETVSDMVSQFKFGFNSNIFLARLIDITNSYYLTRVKEQSLAFSAYEAAAKRFVQFVSALYTASLKANSEEINLLLQTAKASELFQDGIRYMRPLALPSGLIGTFKRSDSIVRFKKNSTVCREGGTARKMYILLRGKVAVTVGKRLVTTISSQGELFCELALFLNGRRTASVVAEEDCDLFVIELKSIRAFHRQYPSFFQACAKTLAQRVVDNLEKIRRFEEIIQGGRTEAAVIGESQFSRLHKEISGLPDVIAGSELALVLQRFPRN